MQARFRMPEQRTDRREEERRVGEKRAIEDLELDT